MFTQIFVIAAAIVLAFFGIFLVWILICAGFGLGFVILEHWASKTWPKRTKISIKENEHFDEWYEEELRKKGVWDAGLFGDDYKTNESIKKMKNFVDNRK
jgi:hypothetical protein